MWGAELKPLVPRVAGIRFFRDVDCLLLQEGWALAGAFVTHAALIMQLLRLSSHLRLGHKAHAQEEAAVTRRPLVCFLAHVNSLVHDEV